MVVTVQKNENENEVTDGCFSCTHREEVSRPVLDLADHVARRRHAAAVRGLTSDTAVPLGLPPH